MSKNSTPSVPRVRVFSFSSATADSIRRKRDWPVNVAGERLTVADAVRQAKDEILVRGCAPEEKFVTALKCAGLPEVVDELWSEKLRRDNSVRTEAAAAQRKRDAEQRQRDRMRRARTGGAFGHDQRTQADIWS